MDVIHFLSTIQIEKLVLWKWKKCFDVMTKTHEIGSAFHCIQIKIKSKLFLMHKVKTIVWKTHEFVTSVRRINKWVKMSHSVSFCRCSVMNFLRARRVISIIFCCLFAWKLHATQCSELCMQCILFAVT